LIKFTAIGLSGQVLKKFKQLVNSQAWDTKGYLEEALTEVSDFKQIERRMKQKEKVMISLVIGGEN